MSARPTEAIVGDWDGTAATVQNDAAAQLADLQQRLRSAYLDIVKLHSFWARGLTAEDRIRAVAYQTCASRLLRILDSQRPQPVCESCSGTRGDSPAELVHDRVLCPACSEDPT